MQFHKYSGASKKYVKWRKLYHKVYVVLSEEETNDFEYPDSVKRQTYVHL